MLSTLGPVPTLFFHLAPQHVAMPQRVPHFGTRYWRWKKIDKHYVQSYKAKMKPKNS